MLCIKINNVFVAALLFCSLTSFVHAQQKPCSNFKKKNKCKKRDYCSWKNNKCIDKAPANPSPSPAPPPTSGLKPCSNFKKKGGCNKRNYCVWKNKKCNDKTAAPTSTPTTSPTASPTGSPTAPPTAPPSSSASPTAPTEPPTATPTATPTESPPSTPSNFNIELVDMGDTPAPAQYAQAFADAKARWESIIRNDLPDLNGSTSYGIGDWFSGAFSQAYTAGFDDLLIGYEVGYIDGPGNVLGSAGCRYSIGNRCVTGVMRFETVDFNSYSAEDIKAIILHEMGHVLGLVGLEAGCNAGCGSGTHVYQCTKATNEYAALNLNQPLLLENNGGSGTACAHWEEQSFATNDSSELMTGFFESHKYQPISRVTIAALDDLGVFEVDYSAADVWPYNGRRLGVSGFQNSFEVVRPTHTFSLSSMMEEPPPTQKIVIDGDIFRKNLRH